MFIQKAPKRPKIFKTVPILVINMDEQRHLLPALISSKQHEVLLWYAEAINT